MNKSEALSVTDLPQQYRDADLMLPDDWSVRRLGDVLDSITNGLTSSQSFDGQGFPVTRIQTIATDSIDASKVGFVDGLDERTVEKYRLVPGDILFSHINSEPQIGRAVLYEGDPPTLLHGMNLLRFRVNTNLIDPSFLVNVLVLLRQLGVFVGLAARAVGQSSINQGKLKTLSIPVPPLEEQQAIASAFRALQHSITTAEEWTSSIREMKRSVLRHLLRWGAAEVGTIDSLRVRESELGPLPEAWATTSVGELADVRGGVGFPPRFQGKAGPYPFYKVSDMNLPGNEVLLEVANNYIDDNILREVKAKLFPKDTIAFPKVGGALYTNKKRMLTKPSLLDNNLMGVTVTDHSRCLPAFLYRWFEDLNLRDLSSPGPLPSINASAVKRTVVPLPPLNEQTFIVSVMDALDAQIEARAAKGSALAEIFNAALREVMTGRRTVSALAEAL